MTFNNKFSLILLSVLLAGGSVCGVHASEADSTVSMTTMTHESGTLLTTMRSWDDYRMAMRQNPGALARVYRAAEAGLSLHRVSVVDKARAPDGGTLHDYTSMGPYWWPDPSTPDGLPYIRRDGDRNPESMQGDKNAMLTLCNAVSSLIHRAWLDDSPGRLASQAHAQQAGRLLRSWFLDEETRMNPNLDFAQGIPGRTKGRGIGIIDTYSFCFLLDEIGLLEHMAETSEWGGKVWTDADRKGIRRWFSDYTDWLITSKNGLDESRQHNNHGTWYDAQVAAFAVFVGRPDVARAQIDELAHQRIEGQIAVDGSQPHELARTLSLNYTNFNLLGFSVLAQIDAGTRDESAGGLPLWQWKAENGAGITTALDWLRPYAVGEKPWTYKQIKPFESSGLTSWIYARAALATGNESYGSVARRMATEPWDVTSCFAAGTK